MHHRRRSHPWTRSDGLLRQETGPRLPPWLRILGVAAALAVIEMGVGLATGLYLSRANLLAFVGYGREGLEVFVDQMLPALTGESLVAGALLTLANGLLLLPGGLRRRRAGALAIVTLVLAPGLLIFGARVLDPVIAPPSAPASETPACWALASLQVLAGIGALGALGLAVTGLISRLAQDSRRLR